jgi:UDP-N-acetylglucosamine 4,6-dehydratase
MSRTETEVKIKMKKFIQGKRILVTGGTGSIGSEIVRQLLAWKPEVVRIFSRDEYKQFVMRHDLAKYSNVRFLLGDIRDVDRITRATEGIDLVFHCAAYKHVPMCEYNPFEAVKTNVIGTENLIHASLSNGVERVVNISTDKAVNPMNVMGATKLLSERLISSAMYSAGNRKTILCTVRFGNVFNSRGSVIPLFKDQIARGGPVTITHPDMTRFFMSIPQAVNLVFKAMRLTRGGELFILKMSAARLGVITEAVIELYSKDNGYKPEQIKKKEIGLRPGEKMDEVLMTQEEAQYAYEFDSMFVVMPAVELPSGEDSFLAKGRPWMNFPVKQRIGEYSSGSVKLLTKNEIKKLLLEN